MVRPGVDVLVVGAGPTGLTTALQAHDHGGTVRVVERREEAFRPSRAMIVHPRTMEGLRPLGVTDALLERADRRPRAQMHVGRRTVDVALGDVAWAATSFPHLTMVRQADVEAVLADALAQRGVEVERGVELVAASTQDDAAHAVLRSHGMFEEATCHFVAGCDGPTSTVRSAAGIIWHGGPYREEVVLADVELGSGLAPGVLHVVVARAGLVFLFALGEGATWRLLATRRTQDTAGPYGQPGEPVPVRDVEDILDRSGLPASVAAVRWSARVRLQHRLARSFREGRLFLAGDAAHAHSPAAAQGMNTGIGDAIGLGWRLALAAGAPGHDALLGSYEAERRRVARQVLALTHAVFFVEASSSPLPSLLRHAGAPVAALGAPVVTRHRAVMTAMVRLLSQDWVSYRDSPLSVQGTAPSRIRAGQHLPDEHVTYQGRRARLHDVVAAPRVHVLLERHADPVDEGRLGPHVAVHRIDSWGGRGLVAVRPDGYVGLASGRAGQAELEHWLHLVAALPLRSFAPGPDAARPVGPRVSGRW